MKKRIFSLMLCACLMCGSVSTFAFTDVENDSPYEQAIERLSSFGIINGYPDGSFKPDGLLTRGQFAKIVVVMQGKEDEAVGKKTAMFTDVDTDNWAIGYINQAATDGVITGYPDGTFGPEENITCNQALTIMVRMLGFSGNGINTRWPDDFVEKAAEYGLTDGVEFDGNDYITRGVTALLLDRLLDKAEGSFASRKFSTKIDDSVIYGTKSVNAGIASDTIVTSTGTYKRGTADADKYLGQKATLWLNSDNEIVQIVPQEQAVKKVTVSATYSDRITTTSGEAIEIDDNTVVYFAGARTTYEKARSGITAGSEMAIYDDYIFVADKKMQGPYTITGGYSQIYSLFGADIMPQVVKDGEAADVTDIEKYDVVYYNNSTNRLYAYSDSVTGIYDAASPTKDNIDTITLSGKPYPIGTAAAKTKLDDSVGSFKIGDRVTLLFGNDGTVVDVVDKDSVSLQDIGVVLSVSTKADAEGQTDFVASLMLGDGNRVSYVTDKNYKKLIGDFVSIEYLGDSAVSLSKVTSRSLVGEFDRTEPSYAEHDFARRYTILELVSLDEDEAVVQKIELRDITQRSLDEDKVIHVEYANSMQDIAVMYVTNVTGANYTYGIVTKSNVTVTGAGDAENVITSFDILTAGGTVNYTASSGYRFSTGTVIGMQIEDNKISSMYALTEVARGRVIQDYTSTKVMIGDNAYKMAEDVQIWKSMGDGTWKTCSFEELKGVAQTEIRLYADKRIDTNGVVKVIKIFK